VLFLPVALAEIKDGQIPNILLSVTEIELLPGWDFIFPTIGLLISSRIFCNKM